MQQMQQYLTQERPRGGITPEPRAPPPYLPPHLRPPFPAFAEPRASAPESPRPSPKRPASGSPPPPSPSPPASPEPPVRIKTEAAEGQEGSVFGGLVSYFSSQREDELDG